MSRLRDRILGALQAEYPGNLTNNQLAVRLGENEPSVRRVTRQLMVRSEIQEIDGGYGNLPVQYAAAYEKEPEVVNA